MSRRNKKVKERRVKDTNYQREVQYSTTSSIENRNYVKVLGIAVTMLTLISLPLIIMTNAFNVFDRLPSLHHRATSERDLSNDFKCMNFLVVVREAIGKSHGAIYSSDFNGIEVLHASYMGITSLAGLEHFHDIIELYVNANFGLSELDVSSNLALEILEARNLGLSELDLSNNRALRVLDISRNDLTELDLYNNRALEEIRAEWNRLTSLDISNHMRLRRVFLAVNELTEIRTYYDLRLYEYFNVVSNPIENDFPRIVSREWERWER